ncbi:BrnA antitoxin family protein [Bartonella sp. B17]
MTIKKTFKEKCNYTKEDWEAVNSPPLTDEELARLKPAKKVLPASFFKHIAEERRKRGRPSIESPKQAITLRLDPEVIAFFKKQGKNWRTRMSEALKKASDEFKYTS